MQNSKTVEAPSPRIRSCSLGRSLESSFLLWVAQRQHSNVTDLPTPGANGVRHKPPSSSGVENRRIEVLPSTPSFRYCSHSNSFTKNKSANQRQSVDGTSTHNWKLQRDARHTAQARVHRAVCGKIAPTGLHDVDEVAFTWLVRAVHSCGIPVRAEPISHVRTSLH